MKIEHTSPYAERRRAEYPPVQEQLDMLWHAMDSGQMAKAEPFYSTLKGVKQKFKRPPGSGTASDT